MDEALSSFRDSFLDFSSAWVQMNESEQGERTSMNSLQQAVATTLISEGQTVEEFRTKYDLSEDTMQSLRRGQHVADLNEVATLPTELRTLNNQLRAEQFEQGFSQLRSMMSSGEIKRSNALLRSCGNIKPTTESKEIVPELRSDDILSALRKMNGED